MVKTISVRSAREEKIMPRNRGDSTWPPGHQGCSSLSRGSELRLLCMEWGHLDLLRSSGGGWVSNRSRGCFSGIFSRSPSARGVTFAFPLLLPVTTRTRRGKSFASSHEAIGGIRRSRPQEGRRKKRFPNCARRLSERTNIFGTALEVGACAGKSP